MPRSRISISALNLAARLVVVFFPGVLLLIIAMRHSGQAATILWIGGAFQVGVCLLFLWEQNNRPQSMPFAILALYVIALAWLWFGVAQEDWLTHLAKALLLVVSLLVLAQQTLIESGAPAIRRACTLANRLASRKDWPPSSLLAGTCPR